MLGMLSLAVFLHLCRSAHRLAPDSCKAGALPAELHPRSDLLKRFPDPLHTALRAHNIDRDITVLNGQEAPNGD